jgi:hypothetical protein
MTKKNAANAGIPEQTISPKKFWGLRTAAVVVIAILTAAAIYIRGVKSFHREKLEKIKAEYNTLSQKVTAIEETKRQRIEFYKNRLLVDSPFKYAFVSADFIRRISLIRSTAIELSAIEIKPAAQNLRFSIAGRVTPAENTFAMEMTFERFFNHVKDFYDVILATSEKKPADNPRQGFFFTIAGEIEAQ